MTDEFAPLLDALRKLKVANEIGFEGFMRDVLQFIAGRPLRLVKSGPQSGKDIVADADPRLPGLAIEAKRFAAKTALPLDELKSKLREALESTPSMDVLILVYSREMHQPDWQELERISEEHGVTLYCLDWRSAPGTLPLIAAVCAAAPHLVKARLANVPDDLIERIQRHPEFTRITDQIRKTLTAPDTGFALAAVAAESWLREAVSTATAARERLRGHAEVLSADAHLIARPAIESQLDQWWTASTRAPVALLGDEGRGKTWAALDWALRKTHAADPIMVLVTSAKDITGTDAGAVLGQILGRSIPLAEPDVLVRRLRRWAGAMQNGERVLLVVDGLNERWNFQWGEFVRLFEAEPWKNRVSLLLTSRTAYWRDDLIRLQGATANPIIEIEVSAFSDAELDRYLGTFGLTKANLPPGLLNIIRIPRFAELAISLRHKLKDAEDLTVARLVLEDWRARLEQKGTDLRVDDEQLLRLVAGLGRNVLEDRDFQISAKEIHERLSAESGRDLDHYRNAISELVEGLWLKAAGRPHNYKVNEVLLPYAIGLDLAQSVEMLADKQAVRDVVAKYEEQLRGADIGVAILRAATSISFARQKATRAAREVLLKAWLDSQNFGIIDFAEMWPLVSRDPDLILDIAEEHWKERPVSHGEGEILAKALANAVKWPNVHKALLAKLPVWAGAFGWDPVAWQFRRNVPVKDERTAGTRSRFDEWQGIQDDYTRLISGHLRADQTDHLPQAALCILSYIHRTPFIDTLVTWAVAHAIMNKENDAEAFEWLLRLNSEDHDTLESALIAESSRLRGFGVPVAIHAANIILDAVATPRALAERSEPVPLSPVRPYPGWPTLADDHRIVWGPEDRESGTEPLRRVNRLAPFAPVPEAVLSAEDLDQVQCVADRIASEPSWFDSFPVQYKDTITVFARWAPAQLGNLTRRIYRELPDRDLKSLSGAADKVEQNAILMGDDERSRLLSGFMPGPALQDSTESEGENDKSALARQALAVAGLIGQPASVQIDTLRSLLPSFRFSRDLARFLASPSTDDLRRIFDWLAVERDEHVLSSWLGYLNEVAREPFPEEARILLTLARHENDGVRGAVFQLLERAGKEFGKLFVDSGWTHEKGQKPPDAICGTYLLAKYGGELPFEAIRSRILPQALAFLVETRGCREPEVRALFDYVNELLDEEITGKRKSRSAYAHVFDAKEAWSKIVVLDDRLVIKKMLQAAARGRVLGFFDIFPLLEIIRAIIPVAPKEAAQIWRLANQTRRDSGISSNDFARLAFSKSDHDEMAKLRREIIGHAKNDADLAEAAYLCVRYGHEAWLISLIQEDIADANAGRIARAIALAGFLDNSSDAQQLWSQSIESLPLNGWLAEVRTKARTAYESNIHARHWFERFFSTEDRDEAYGCLRLFHECADSRCGLWGQDIVDKARPSAPPAWLSHLDATAHERSNRLKNVSEERKKSLFFTGTVSYVAPWF